MTEVIIEEFNRNKQRYESLKYKCKSLIIDLLIKNEIKFHKIESRVKDKESLGKKISSESKAGKYHSLDDVTDVLGIRIITYLEDDVDKVAKLLNKEFKLDLINSVDKRLGSNPDVFGYASLHQVLSVSDSRISLPEYEHLKDLKFEVQIRSILQHAWAEIEHDLGYKSKLEIPEEIRRDFSRIAGLLELADREFIRIKDFLDGYSLEMESKIREHDLNIPIDKITLIEYLFSSPTVEEIMKSIYNESVLNSNRLDKELLVPELMLKSLTLFNITTISQLDDMLKENQTSIPKFIETYKSDLKKPGPTLAYDIVIVYLIYIFIYRDYSKEKLTKFINIFEKDESALDQLDKSFMKLLDGGFKI